MVIHVVSGFADAPLITPTRSSRAADHQIDADRLTTYARAARRKQSLGSQKRLPHGFDGHLPAILNATNQGTAWSRVAQRDRFSAVDVLRAVTLLDGTY
jgi:hypothetical protein